MQSNALRFALVALVWALAGCGPDRQEAGESGGTIVIAATSDPDALFPAFSLNLEARQATEMIYEYLADVGPAMNTIGDSGFVKELADSWKWSADSSEVAFTINPRAKWHDGHRVTAHDVAFSFDLYNDPGVGSMVASSLSDIAAVTASDSSTVVFRFVHRSPHQFYDAAAQMLILPSHLLAKIPRDSLRAVTARSNPIGSGRFAFSKWTRGASIELEAVAGHYRGRAHPDRVIWTVTPEYQSAVKRLLGGEADVFPTVRAETIPELSSRFNLISLPGMDYVFMGFNMRRPLFASRDVRRAITMSLDRAAMVRNVFDTLARVSIGPTIRAYPTTDTTVAQIPFDRAGAERLLDSLGWRRARAGGMRSRAGVPLRFGVIVPVSSLSRMRMAVLMQEQLRLAGIEMHIEQMDYSAFTARQRRRDFDAQLAAWHMGSRPGAVRDTWTSSAARPDGLNYGEYSNPAFDSLVNSAFAMSTVAETKSLLSRAYQVIVDDAPAVWLYEPITLVAVHRRIRTTPMRPNAWWLGIPDWTIPASERLPRDAIGTAQGARRN